MNVQTLLLASLTLVSCGKTVSKSSKKIIYKTKTKIVEPTKLVSSCDVYETIGYSSLPNFSLLSSLGKISISKLDNPNTSVGQVFKTFEGTDFENTFEQFGLSCNIKLELNEAGVYSFCLQSDDGSKLILGNSILINNDGLHGSVTKCFSGYFEKGVKEFKLDYFQNFGGKNLKFYYTKPNSTMSQLVEF